MRICVIHAERARTATPRSLYERTAAAVLAKKRLGVAIVVGSLMHASGHALLAAAGGTLARQLAGGEAPMDARSTSLLSAVGHGDPLLGLAIAGLFAAIVKLVGGVVAGASEARVAGEVGARLRIEVLERVLTLNSLRAPRQHDHGSAERTAAHDLTALTTHVHDVERGISHGVLAESRALVQLVPLGLLLVALAPRLAGTAVLALGLFALFAFSVRRAFKRAHARAATTVETLAGAADEAVRHAELWATYGAVRKIRAHVAVLSEAIAEDAAALRARAALLSGTSEVLGALALVLALALVASGATGGVDRSSLVPFAIAFFMAYRPLRDLVDARIVRARGEAACLAATRRGGDTSSAASKEEDPPRRWPPGDLVLDRVVGAHGDCGPVSLTLPFGGIAAIVGRTGIGKTQLLRALLGLERARSGSVRYAGILLDRAGVGPAERPFAWVPQEAPLLRDTLTANVGLAAKESASVNRSLAAVGAGALATTFGDDVLGPDRAPSGGERQQIAVARALATELPVLLLDEPTSALDAASEARVLGAIAALRGTRTVLLVTHRTAPLAIADVVVRLDVDDRQDGTGRDLDEVAAE